MSYLRVKWIKGHPYFYEQASYRIGKQVKTRHIRYIGKFGWKGGTGVSHETGFIPPADLTQERQKYINNKLSRLTEGDAYPYERDILRQYLYCQNYKFAVFSEKNTYVIRQGLKGYI